MKVAIVTNKIQGTGGVEVFTRDLSNLLSQRGHKVTLFGEESLPTPIKGDKEKAVGEYFNTANKSQNFDTVVCNGEFGFAVEHKHAIDIFHGNYYGYARAVEKLVPKELTNERLEKAKMQTIAAQGKYVVTVSDFAIDGLNKSGINVNQVIKNSVDGNLFYPLGIKNSEYSLALARGRYFEKGFDIIKKLAERGIKLDLFSDNSIDTSNVNNHSFLNNNDLIQQYNQAAVFLHPSRFEGGSLVTLEAMACGCPILTTPVGYGPEIKNEIPNFVASPDNIEEIFAKYVIISNAREKYSKLARDYFIEYHNPESFKKQWIEVIEGI
jgi:glycosyltransferase involved in cell wall biosynthesis